VVGDLRSSKSMVVSEVQSKMILPRFKDNPKGGMGAQGKYGKEDAIETMVTRVRERKRK